jgi:hypothetical protein
VAVYDAAGDALDMFQVAVYKLDFSVDEWTPEQLRRELEALLASFERQDPSLRIEAPLAETAVAGMDGYRFTYRFAKGDGRALRATAYYLFDGNVEYQLTTQALIDNWDLQQPVFEAMLASFAAP